MHEVSVNSGLGLIALFGRSVLHLANDLLDCAAAMRLVAVAGQGEHFHEVLDVTGFTLIAASGC